jgi:hypothetical protein
VALPDQDLLLGAVLGSGGTNFAVASDVVLNSDGKRVRGTDPSKRNYRQGESHEAK